LRRYATVADVPTETMAGHSSFVAVCSNCPVPVSIAASSILQRDTDSVVAVKTFEA
jgi:hypothetical protein